MMSSTTAATVLTAEELAARWKLKSAHIYRLARAGELDGCLFPLRNCRYRRFRLGAVEAFEWGELGEETSS